MHSITKGVVGGLIAGAATFAAGEAFMHTPEPDGPPGTVSSGEAERRQMIIATAVVIGSAVGAFSFGVSLYREPDLFIELPPAV